VPFVNVAGRLAKCGWSPTTGRAQNILAELSETYSLTKLPVTVWRSVFLELKDEPLMVSCSSDSCMRMARLAVMASAAAGIAFAMQCLGQDALKLPDRR